MSTSRGAPAVVLALALSAVLMATTPSAVSGRTALSLLPTEDAAVAFPAKIYESGDAFDLEGRAVTFKAPGMRPCVTEGVTAFPVDPSGGEVLAFKYSYDYTEEIRFGGGFKFPFVGSEHSTAYVNSRGYVTFEASDSSYPSDLDTHFAVPRVSVLYADFDFQTESVASWKQLEGDGTTTYGSVAYCCGGQDRVVITYERLEGCDFQLALHADGSITFSYINVNYESTKIIGLSGGVSGAAMAISGSSACEATDAMLMPTTAPQAKSFGMVQLFEDGYDLQYSMISFQAPDYTPCVTFGLSTWPVDPVGGEVLPTRYSYEYNHEVRFSGGFKFPFMGVSYTTAYVNYKGFITFDEPSDEISPSIRSFYMTPRLSALYSSLSLDEKESLLTYKQLEDRMVITYQGLSDSSFQVALMSDGTFTVAYMKMSSDISDALVGVSFGASGPVVELTANDDCPASEPVATEAPAPGLTEVFDSGFDLEETTVTFTPGSNYKPCITWGVDKFPVDPKGGEVLPFEYTYEYNQEVRFDSGFKFPFNGVSYTSVYVNYKGFLTFDEPDDTIYPSAAYHFIKPRLSVMYSGLSLYKEGTLISWKQLEGNSAVVITYERVSDSDFQVVLYPDGTFSFTYLKVEASDDLRVVGMSLGTNGPMGDISSSATCSSDVPVPAVSATADSDGIGEVFVNGFDLEHTSVTFAAPGYVPCATWGVDSFPVDPRGGEVLPMQYTYSYIQEIRFEGFSFPFNGASYTSAFVSRRGYITFDEADDDFAPSLRSHFVRPRISVLYTSLGLSDEETLISWRQLEDRVVITYQGVSDSHFQVALAADGSITMTYLDITTSNDAKVVGVSLGVHGGTNDFSSASACASAPITAAMPEGLDLALTQAFVSGTDLHNMAVTYEAADYSACTTVGMDGLLMDPEGGEALELGSYYDWEPIQVNFKDGFKFPFQGKTHSSVYVSKKGYLVFDPAEDLPNFPSIRSHFSYPRISVMYSDWKYSNGGPEVISWKQSGDTVVVTWENVEEENSFQAVLSSDGGITLSYGAITKDDTTVSGVSWGVAGTVQDLSTTPSCSERSSTIGMGCPEGHNMTVTQNPEGMDVTCTDGSSLFCGFDFASQAVECTVTSKLI